MAKIMSLTIPIFCALCCIIIQLISTDIVKGDSSGGNNDTETVVPGRISGRSKRSLYRRMLNKLNIRMQNGKGDGINLVWIKQHQALANKHLPIALPNGYKIRNVMTVLGEFIVYLDIDKCSAVVYFEKTNTLSGNIGLEYTITDLPFEFDLKGTYLGTEGYKYISKRKDQPPHILPQIPHEDLDDLFGGCNRESDERMMHNAFAITRGIEFQSHHEPNPSKRRRIERDLDEINPEEFTNANVSRVDNIRERRETPKIFRLYYLEILVFVTREVVDLYRAAYEGNTYVEAIVKDYIIFFNTVDMYFQKLKTTYEVMRINLAKIVLEDEAVHIDILGNDGRFLFDESIKNRRAYLDYNQQLYPRDSYDYVFISTSRPIWDKTSIVPGKTDYKADLYEARKIGKWYDAVPITIMGYFEYHALIAHEIGRTLNFEIEPWNIKQDIRGQCYAIMQSGGPKCYSCLQWSYDNEKQFVKFFRENRNRCFLMNEPRALRRSSVRHFNTLDKQCQCFGYDTVASDDTTVHRGYIEKNDCNKIMQCAVRVGEQTTHEDTITPLDGSYCDGRIKVCWDGQCLPITYW